MVEHRVGENATTTTGLKIMKTVITKEVIIIALLN